MLLPRPLPSVLSRHLYSPDNSRDCEAPQANATVIHLVTVSDCNEHHTTRTSAQQRPPAHDAPYEHELRYTTIAPSSVLCLPLCRASHHAVLPHHPVSISSLLPYFLFAPPCFLASYQSYRAYT
ncbi:hypothetical protein VNO80_01575 [Phaseolus coccineus]|uniref:Uncharacterized protein n=1 Tax=Phaseolus coccineus TaxID=3886 RepID=A0AAN9RT05_PHACN